LAVSTSVIGVAANTMRCGGRVGETTGVGTPPGGDAVGAPDGAPLGEGEAPSGIGVGAGGALGTGVGVGGGVAVSKTVIPRRYAVSLAPEL
jgi:hypothetical protein